MAVIMALTACSSGGSGPAPSESGAAGAVTLGADEPLAPAGDLTGLKWPFGEQLDAGFADAADGFAEWSSGSSLTYQDAPLATYEASLVSLIRTGELPDLVMMFPFLTNEPAWPAVVPLTEAEIGDLSSELTNWAGAAAVDGPEGQFFGVPLGVQGVPWYLSTSAFEKAGLDPSAPPTTWEELADVCEALVAVDIPCFGVSGADGYTSQFMFGGLATQYYPSDEDFLKFVTGETTFTDPGVKSAVEYMKETYDNGWWDPDYAGKTFTDVSADFVSGEVGIVTGLVTGLLDWATWDTQMEDGSYAAFAPPLLPDAATDVQIFPSAAVQILTINQKAESPQLVADAINYLVSKEGQTAVLEQGGQLPNRTDVDVEAAISSTGGRQVYEAASTLKAVPYTFAAMKGPVNTALQQNLNQAIASGDIDEFLTNLADLQASS